MLIIGCKKISKIEFLKKNKDNIYRSSNSSSTLVAMPHPHMNPPLNKVKHLALTGDVGRDTIAMSYNDLLDAYRELKAENDKLKLKNDKLKLKNAKLKNAKT
jgi:hypothetical protein